ncbi:putative short transient receptor potential channel 2-like protein isoform X6 [Chelonia mydas]|uniref:putative short transient receptor potential channel 2-like protein isoform X6 n=1 Tax=Chelonia mydas TaxID=8469 RepID=UPI001CA9C0CB|nr:putative short transient receptor potential channel 2-like protein isoform X6 [Chelonia mydas]XP_043382946.1 putative short transient receptor potential channel 2-like protein isoform X6 [Chelonia mydas]
MAPVKINHVVSFTSQDPRYPVENLLHDDDIHPWLSCPQDRSRQLKVELQLERASPIGYIDIGDFLAAALGEKWDRVRITCSQPFNKQAQFGLSFIHIRTPLDPNHSQAAPPPPQMGHEPAASPWLASPAFRRAFFPEVQPSKGEEEEELKSRLQLLEPSCGPHPRSPACLSRTARMVLSAAQSRSRALQLGPSATSLAAERRASSRGQQGEDPAVSPTAAGPMQDVHDAPPLRKVRVKPSRRRRSQGAAGRSMPRPGTQGGRARGWGGRPNKLDDRGEAGGEMGVCPICAGCFSTDLLPVHASACGEDGSLPDTAWPSPPREDPQREELPEAWVPCPICEFRFSTAEVERHASTCGEQAGALETPHSWLWVE